MLFLPPVSPWPVTHETNLVWAQTPFSRAHSNARLMAIAGDPNTWVTTEKFKVCLVFRPGARLIGGQVAESLVFVKPTLRIQLNKKQLECVDKVNPTKKKMMTMMMRGKKK